MPTLDQLRATAEAAERKASRASELAAAEQARHDQARQQRLDAYDRQLVNDYDDDAADREVDEARRALAAAVLDSPGGQAAVAARLAMTRRSQRYNEVAGAAARLGDADWPTTNGQPAPGHLDVRETVQHVVERAAHQAAAEADAAAAAERDRAGDDGPP